MKSEHGGAGAEVRGGAQNDSPEMEVARAESLRRVESGRTSASPELVTVGEGGLREWVRWRAEVYRIVDKVLLGLAAKINGPNLCCSPAHYY